MGDSLRSALAVGTPPGRCGIFCGPGPSTLLSGCRNHYGLIQSRMETLLAASTSFSLSACLKNHKHLIEIPCPVGEGGCSAFTFRGLGLSFHSDPCLISPVLRRAAGRALTHGGRCRVPSSERRKSPVYRTVCLRAMVVVIATTESSGIRTIIQATGCPKFTVYPIPNRRSTITAGSLRLK